MDESKLIKILNDDLAIRNENFAMELESIMSNKNVVEEVDYSKKFKNKEKLTYRGKSWTVKASTPDWVEIVDNRGFAKLINFDDILSYKNGTLMSESFEDYSNRIMLEIDKMNSTSNRVLENSGIVNEAGSIPRVMSVLKSKPLIAVGLLVMKHMKDNTKTSNKGLFVRVTPQHALRFWSEGAKLRVNWIDNSDNVDNGKKTSNDDKIPTGKFGYEDVINLSKAIQRKYNQANITDKFTKITSKFSKDLNELGDKLKVKK